MLGVSRDERERLRLMLYEAADSSTRRKILIDGSFGGIYLGVGVLGGIVLDRGIRQEASGPIVLGSTLLAAGAAVTTWSAIRLFRPTYEERAYERFVKRLETESAWAEAPPSRTRHFVSNVLAEPGARPDEIAVRSSFMVTRTRADHGYQLFTGRREDVLRLLGDAMKIARRRILVDQTVITNSNLSVLF